MQSIPHELSSPGIRCSSSDPHLRRHYADLEGPACVPTKSRAVPFAPLVPESTELCGSGVSPLQEGDTFGEQLQKGLDRVLEPRGPWSPWGWGTSATVSHQDEIMSRPKSSSSPSLMAAATSVNRCTSV